MDVSTATELVAMAMETEAMADSVFYLTAQLGQFIRRNDKVVICFPDHSSDNIGGLMERAVIACGAVPVLWGADHRWKSLLQLAFFSRASVIIGPPIILLGLAKLQKHTGLPLYVHHVVSAGYPCLDWMIEGIRDGLDCKVWGCFGIGTSAAVGGFSCGHSLGVHIRQEEYTLETEECAAPSTSGRIRITSNRNPAVSDLLPIRGKMEYERCDCGSKIPRLMDIHPGDTVDEDMLTLGQYLNSWTSVLDCRIRKGECGLELEMVVFPGEKLPKLPSFAKRIIRPWDPKHDTPFVCTST